MTGKGCSVANQTCDVCNARRLIYPPHPPPSPGEVVWYTGLALMAHAPLLAAVFFFGFSLFFGAVGVPELQTHLKASSGRGRGEGERRVAGALSMHVDA